MIQLKFSLFTLLQLRGYRRIKADKIFMAEPFPVSFFFSRSVIKGLIALVIY